MSTDNGEQDRLLDHSYDGIQEYDNPMPRWWVWIFWATIVFSVLYVLDFTGKIRGPGRVAEYQAQLADAELRWPAGSEAGADSATLVALAGDPARIADGKVVYDTYCAVCHRADLGGAIGPNLVDEYWLHGGSIVAIRNTIREGVLEKGMPNWGKILQPAQVDAVSAYVASQLGSSPANPRDPQGTRAGGGGDSAAVRTEGARGGGAGSAGGENKW